jgi:hypothetical protein
VPSQSGVIFTVPIDPQPLTQPQPWPIPVAAENEQRMGPSQRRPGQPIRRNAVEEFYADLDKVEEEEAVNNLFIHKERRRLQLAVDEANLHLVGRHGAIRESEGPVTGPSAQT